MSTSAPPITREALVDAAEALFTEHGYAATSLDAIVAAAQVTKGALYHHFSGKQALFEAVLERVETQGSETVRTSVAAQSGAWGQADAGLRSLVEVVRRPAYRRIVLHEGPAVLGYERFREHEERSTFVHVTQLVRSVLATGTAEVDEDLVETFSRIFFGAVSCAGETISSSADPHAAGERVELAIGLILSGLRGVLESGATLAPAR